MRKGRSTEEQIIKVLREHAAGLSANDLCGSRCWTYRRSRRYSKKILTPSLRRCAVTRAIDEKGYSQRRACRLVGLHPKTYRYASMRPTTAPCGSG
jgi:hypothetical protein